MIQISLYVIKTIVNRDLKNYTSIFITHGKLTDCDFLIYFLYHVVKTETKNKEQKPLRLSSQLTAKC